MAKRWNNYREIIVWYDTHALCPICEAPSPKNGGMLCKSHSELWAQEPGKDTPSSYLEFVNELRCPAPVLADSDWIADA